MRAVEELVCRKLEKRAPDDFRLNLTLTNSVHHKAVVPTATQTEGNQSGQTLLSQIRQASNFNGD